MRKPVLTIVVATVLAALPFTAGGSTAGATTKPGPGTYKEYVALGDSWSADVVIADTDGIPDSTYAPTGCAQSHRNYPKLLAAALKVPVFRDATCGSATTSARRPPSRSTHPNPSSSGRSRRSTSGLPGPGS